MFKKMIIPNVFANCTYNFGDVKTQPGLAISPADAMRMADRGIPISSVNADMFFDGEVNPSWSVSPERVRGIDAADLWQAQKTARRRIKAAHLDDVAVYGNPSVNPNT